MKIPFISRSTLEFFKEARKTPGYSWFDALHGYVYGRWTHLYIGIGVGEHPWAKRYGPLLARLAGWYKRVSRRKQEQTGVPVGAAKPGFADTYHGKVMPLDSAKRLVMVKEDIRVPDLEQVIPYQRARSIVLHNPDHIVALECPCRSARPNPCLPLDVCLVVGEPFASFIIEHSPDKARWITPEEAVEILKAEDERGHVHHAFFKDAMLERFYAICNCCACCCGAMQAQRHGTPMLASSGYVAQVDAELCIGCETCQEYCQFGALSMSNYTVVVDFAACMGCGVCVDKCEQGALSLQRVAEKGIPLEIQALMDAAVQ